MLFFLLSVLIFSMLNQLLWMIWIESNETKRKWINWQYKQCKRACMCIFLHVSEHFSYPILDEIQRNLIINQILIVWSIFRFLADVPFWINIYFYEYSETVLCWKEHSNLWLFHYMRRHSWLKLCLQFANKTSK